MGVLGDPLPELRRGLAAGRNGVAPESLLFVVADLSKLWVEAKVPLAHIDGLKKGHRVKVFSDKTGRSAEGDLAYIASMAEPTTRTVLVRVEVDNAAGDWRPGMCARLDFANQTTEAAVAVPSSAVHDIDARSSVFVEQAPGRFELRAVEIGVSDEKHVHILSGLKAGEKVATDNSLSLKAEWLNR